jgi:putative ABC transport system permease protein
MARLRTLEAEVLLLYRGFLRLYPAEFRAEYGRELCLVFKDRWREEHSLARLLGVWFHAVSGILTEAPREHCQMIVQDLRYALRIMRKDALVTSAAIVILALGIGSTTLVFSLANGLLIRPLPYPEPDRLVAVTEYSPSDPNEARAINFLNYLDIRVRARSFEDVGVYYGDDLPIRGEGNAERVYAAQVTDGVFRVLHVPPVLGRFFTREDDLPNAPKVVVLGEELWQRRYGRDPKILGHVIDTGGDRYTVIGVMPADFHFPDRAEAWLPIQMDPAKATRTDYFMRSVARLKPGVSVAQATSEAYSLLERIHRENPVSNNGWHARAVPIREIVAGRYRTAVITLLAAVGLLLLIACANVSNLLLVKASARVREMALRTALGASRRRIVRQLLSEGLLLGLAGGALGVLLAYLGIPALLALIPVDILPRWMNFSVDHRVLGFALAVSLLTSVVFAIAPAFGLFGGNLTDTLKEGGRGGSAGVRQKLLRNVLVVGEVALSVTLLTGAGLMVRSFLALRLQNLGFRSEKILSLDVGYPQHRYPDGPQARALLQQLTAEVASLPGVTSTAFTSGVPLNDGWGRIYTIEGRPMPLKDMRFINHVVSTPGYFRTLGIPLLKGRDFTAADYDAPHIVIVSQAFVKMHWPRENPIGKRLRFGPPAKNEPWHTVVGVVADSRHGQLKGEDRPNVYLPFSPEFSLGSLLIRTSADPLKLVKTIRDRIVGTDHDIDVSHVFSLEQIVDRVAWQDRFFTVLFGAFAVLALVLAAVGLYATLSYTVSLHTHEIGVRMALGASASRVRGMVIRQGLALAGTGLFTGILAALALTRLLKAQLYGISPMDPVSYFVVPVVLMLVALLAASEPTRRATRVDPIVALRHE